MNEEGNEHKKRVFETANKYHFYHTIALLAVPLCHYPLVVSISVLYPTLECLNKLLHIVEE